jgi:hypothetical protein
MKLDRERNCRRDEKKGISEADDECDEGEGDMREAVETHDASTQVRDRGKERGKERGYCALSSVHRHVCFEP